MAEKSPTESGIARKSLIDVGPARPCAETNLLPWLAAGDPPFGAMNCRIAPGKRSEPDTHNQDEIVFVHRGAGEIDIGGHVVSISEGDVVFVPRNVDHVVRNTRAIGDLSFFSVWWPRVEPPR